MGHQPALHHAGREQLGQGVPARAARGLTCDSEDFYNSECHTSAIFLPKLEAGNTQYIGFFHTGAYQESLGGFGGIQHCLIPAPKHIIIDRDKSDNEYYTRLFAKEQSYRSMLRILGY